MQKIITYSLLLIFGIALSQYADLTDYMIKLIDIPIPLTHSIIPLSNIQIPLKSITMICLAYIMIEVGFEFVLDKNNLSSYFYDYLVAMTAAAFPWIFCALYFYYFIGTDLKESLLVGRFAAPTSAGVLFAMLSAAGLAATWLFKKARILAIFDDLDTVLLMIPLQILFTGFRLEAFILIFLLLLMLFVAYRYLHELKLPTHEGWMLFYGIAIVFVCSAFKHLAHIEFEVLLPAFVFGCLLYNPYDLKHKHLHQFLEPEGKSSRFIDMTIKYVFMFLVGCSIPQIDFVSTNLVIIAIHIVMLTLLSNLGKSYPTFCYRNEASLRERLALSVAMFPRGEVGAGVLLIAMEYNINEEAIEMAALSLTLNLLFTGIFILIVIWLIKPIYRIENQ